MEILLFNHGAGNHIKSKKKLIILEVEDIVLCELCEPQSLARARRILGGHWPLRYSDQAAENPIISQQPNYFPLLTRWFKSKVGFMD